jgi:hypothetical protein
MAAAPYRVSKGASASDPLKHPPDRLTVGAVGGGASNLLQCLDKAEPGAGKLAKLMIKISASRQLARGKDHRRASNRHAVEAGFEIALAA